MREVVVSGFKSLKTVNLALKTKNVAEGRKCTKTQNWIKIRAKRKKNNVIDNTLNKTKVPFFHN